MLVLHTGGSTRSGGRWFRWSPSVLLLVLLLLIGEPPRAEALAIVAWYMLNETAGSTSVKDYSGNAYDATPQNSPTFNGDYMELTSASSQYVSLPAGLLTGMGNLGSFSSTAWVYMKTTSARFLTRLWEAGEKLVVLLTYCFAVSWWLYTWQINQYARIWEFYRSSSYYMRLSPYHNGGNYIYGIIELGWTTNIESSLVTSAGQWYHLGVTYNDATSTTLLYVNGASAALGSSSSISTNPNQLGPFAYAYLGKAQGSYPYLNGYLKDVRIYSGVLSATDVFRIYSYNTKSPTTVPTLSPSVAPTVAPTTAPTIAPTKHPTAPPTTAPTTPPTTPPTVNPTVRPSQVPTLAPSLGPTLPPTLSPTQAPTQAPTRVPSQAPTQIPTLSPTVLPTTRPTVPPTLFPTNVPTRQPTERPTKAPTVKPTSVPTSAPTVFAASLSLLSTSYTRSPTSAIPVVNPTQALTITVTSTSAATNNTWSSPNATLETAIRRASSPSRPFRANAAYAPFYLWLPAGTLTPTATSSLFLLRWTTYTSGSGRHTAQLAIQMNRPPTNGSVNSLPSRGVSLQTNFTIRARWWTDPEADLPLAYSYTAGGVLLAQRTGAQKIWSYLPASQNLSVEVQVYDSFGASAIALSTVSSIVKASSLVQAASLVQSRMTAITTDSNSTTFTRELAIAAVAASSLTNVTISTTSGGTQVINATATQTALLDLLSTLLTVYPREMLTLPAAATAAVTIRAVTNTTEPLPLATQYKAMDTLNSFMTRLDNDYFETSIYSTTAVERLGSATVHALSDLVGGGLLTSPMCRQRRPSQVMDNILTSLSGVAADGLTPGGTSLSYSATYLGLRVARWSYRQLPNNANYNITYTSTTSTGVAATVRVPASVLWQMKPQLCSDGAMAFQAVTWGVDKHACYKNVSSTANSHRYADVVPHVGTLALLRSCANSSESLRLFPAATTSAVRVLAVQNTSSPIVIDLPTSGAKSQSADREVTLPTGDCVFWNSSSKAWSREGCQRRTTLTGSDAMSGRGVCECTHLSDFSIIADSVGITAQQYKQLENTRVLRRNMGLLVMLGLMYMVFFVSMMWGRWRTTKTSWEYMKRVPTTRMYKSAVCLIEKQLGVADAKGLIDSSKIGEALLAQHNMKDLLLTARRVRAKRLMRLRTLARPTDGGGWWSSPCTWWSKRASHRVYGEEDQDSDKDLQAPGKENSASRLTQSLTLPLNQLNTPQLVMIGFIKVLTQLTLALVLVGAGPMPVTAVHDELLGLRLDRGQLVHLFLQVLLQSILAEPILCVIHFMLLVVNRETSVRVCVGEDVVDRDLELMVPSLTQRISLGPLYVPMMRIGLIQLDLALQHIKHTLPQYDHDGNMADLVTAKSRVTYATALAKEVERLRRHSKEEYYAQHSKQVRHLEDRLIVPRNYWEAMSLRLRLLSSYFQRVPEFIHNPLEPIDAETQVARVYDDWISEQMLGSSVLSKRYYTIFVAEARHHVVGQEFFLFSWRLLLLDLVLLAYVLLLTFYLLRISLNIRADTVVYALLSMAGGLMASTAVISPLVGSLQAVLGYRVMDRIRRALLEKHGEFEHYYSQNNTPAVQQGSGDSAIAPAGHVPTQGKGTGVKAAAPYTRAAQVAPVHLPEGLWAAQLLGDGDFHELSNETLTTYDGGAMDVQEEDLDTLSASSNAAPEQAGAAKPVVSPRLLTTALPPSSVNSGGGDGDEKTGNLQAGSGARRRQSPRLSASPNPAAGLLRLSPTSMPATAGMGESDATDRGGGSSHRRRRSQVAEPEPSPKSQVSMSEASQRRWGANDGDDPTVVSKQARRRRSQYPE